MYIRSSIIIRLLYNDRRLWRSLTSLFSQKPITVITACFYLLYWLMKMMAVSLKLWWKFTPTHGRVIKNDCFAVQNWWFCYILSRITVFTTKVVFHHFVSQLIVSLCDIYLFAGPVWTEICRNCERAGQWFQLVRILSSLSLSSFICSNNAFSMTTKQGTTVP